jgi:hypothetical protein
MRRLVHIEYEGELYNGWRDDRLPHMGFSFEQTDPSQLIEMDGKLYASYVPMEVLERMEVSFLDNERGMVSVVVEPGTYGIHPKDK